MPLVQPGQHSRPKNLRVKTMVTRPDPSQVFEQQNNRQSYSMCIVPLTGIRAYIATEFPAVAKQLSIPLEEFESMYDWIVTEAVNKILSLKCGRVNNHYRHDYYKCAYDTFGPFAEYAISREIASHNLSFLNKEEVKIMVAGDSLILARGVSYK